MKKYNIREYIEENNVLMQKLLLLSGTKRLNTINWLRREFSHESEILFQLSASARGQKRLYIDYNNLKKRHSKVL